MSSVNDQATTHEKTTSKKVINQDSKEGIYIFLANNIAQELQSISLELQEKESDIIEKALSLYFYYLDEQLADKRLEDLSAGREKIYSAADVWSELGL